MDEIRSVILGVRLTPTEKVRLFRLAKRRSTNASDLTREALTPLLAEVGDGRSLNQKQSEEDGDDE